ncbi:MAG: hypothetical protein WBP72_13890 [Rhodocyclaceae bacterium]
MRTHSQFIPRLFAAAALSIGATVPLGAAAGGVGAGVASQTNVLDMPFYLQAGSLALSTDAVVQRDSGREVAAKTNALDIPFYLLPDTSPATSGPRAKAEGREVASTTYMLEIPQYLRPGK